jgi:phosphatidate cytidylyltransferase
MAKLSETKKRVITTLLFLPILLYSIFSSYTIIFFILILVVILLAQKEFYSLFKTSSLQEIIGIIISMVLASGFYFMAHELSFKIIPFYLVFSLIVEVFRKNKNITKEVGIGLLGVVYIGWLLSHLLILKNTQGNFFVFLVFLITWLSDIAGYFIGRYWGKRKIFLSISPNKTIEGTTATFLTAFFVTLLTHFIVKNFYTQCNFGYFNIIQILVLGILMGFGCILGDLAESLFKRSVEAKDTSNLIPGHGGVLDVIDSLLFTGVIMYYFNEFKTLLW